MIEAELFTQSNTDRCCEGGASIYLNQCVSLLAHVCAACVRLWV